MPYNEPDPADPTMLIGVPLPANPEADTEMAYAFAEEFASMGYSEAQLLRLFQNPFYAGAFAVTRRLGESKIQEIVKECINLFGRVHFNVQDV